MGAVFLNHVVTPIVNSPAGPVFSNIAAVTGLAAKGVLDMGSGVLNTAAQFSVLAVNIQNAKGFTNLFKSSLEFLGAPFKAVGGMVRGFITNLFGIGASSGIAAAGTGGLGVAGAGAAGGIGAAAGATGAFAASLWAAAWPILAVVGAVALLAGSTYLLIKNWDSVAGFFVGLWNKITGVFSAAGDSISAFFVNLRQKITGVFSVARTWITAFFPSLANSIGNFFSPVIGKISGVISSFANRVSGIWNTVTDTFTSAWGHVVSFFSSLWNTMVSIVINAGNWFVSVWGTITDTFAGAWGHVVSFFSSLWNTMVSIVTNAGNWFASVWGTVTNTFAGAWLWVSNLFTSIWEGMKGVVLGFVEWLSPVIDAILAPFREMGRVIGGITTTVGGWFGDAVNAGNSAVAEMKLNQDITRTATALTEAAAPSALTDTAPFLPGTVTSAVAAPFFGEPIVPPSAFSGNTVPASETLPAFAAPLRASAPELTYTASSAFSNAVSGASAMLTPALDMSALERQVDMRLPQAPAVAAPWQKTTAEQPKQAGPISISVRHLTVQAEDIKDAVDFYRILMNTVYQPEEAPV
jgi:hypothetical protein